MRFLSIAILLMAWSASALAQELWNGVRVGDSVELIQDKFPAAVVPEKANALVDGSTTLLEAHGIPIARVLFKAEFFFKDRQLTAVGLTLSPRIPMPQALATLETLLNALRAKYGAPFSVSDGVDTLAGRSGLINARATWRSGRVDIAVSMIGLAERDPKPPHLTVLYTTLLAQDADKL